MMQSSNRAKYQTVIERLNQGDHPKAISKDMGWKGPWNVYKIQKTYGFHGVLKPKPHGFHGELKAKSHGCQSDHPCCQAAAELAKLKDIDSELSTVVTHLSNSFQSIPLTIAK